MTFRRTLVLMGIALAAVAGSQAQTGAKKNDPDLKEIRDYRLSMDAIQKYTRAMKALSEDAETKKCFDSQPPGNAPSLDEGQKMFNRCPAALADVKKAGLNPREFLLVTGAVIGDFITVSMKKSGAIKEYPPTISPENAAFIEQNYDKVQAMLAPLMGPDK